MVAASSALLRVDIDVAADGGCRGQRAGVGAEVGEDRRNCIGIAAVAGSTAAVVEHVACSSSAFVEEGVVVGMLVVLDNIADGGDEEGVVEVVVAELGILVGEDIGAFPGVSGYSAEFAAAV